MNLCQSCAKRNRTCPIEATPVVSTCVEYRKAPGPKDKERVTHACSGIETVHREAWTRRDGVAHKEGSA